MADLQRVPIDRPLPPSLLPALFSVLGVLLALAILKPWQDPSASSAEGNLEAPGAPTRPAPTPRVARSAYDPRLFGIREPDPAWELWPAGYVVEFGIAGPLPVTEVGAASASPPAHASAQPPGASPDQSPVPDVVDLGPTDHLVALGINTPAHVRVDRIELWLLAGATCCTEAVPILRLPTLWDSRHFLVIGVADAIQPNVPGDWAPGEYRVDLTTVTGEILGLRFRVAPASDPGVVSGAAAPRASRTWPGQG